MNYSKLDEGDSGAFRVWDVAKAGSDFIRVVRKQRLMLKNDNTSPLQSQGKDRNTQKEDPAGRGSPGLFSVSTMPAGLGNGPEFRDRKGNPGAPGPPHTSSDPHSHGQLLFQASLVPGSLCSDVRSGNRLTSLWLFPVQRSGFSLLSSAESLRLA